MKIALLGAGLLGQSIAERLATAGHQIVVYNRTRAKAERLRAFGISLADRPDEAIRTATAVFLLLADNRAIQEVLLAEVTRRELGNRTIIQMGTIGPVESVQLQQEMIAAKGDYFEAPVLGSQAEARSGKLIVMVGASPEQFRAWEGVLQCLDPAPRLIGPVGQAAALKLALNQLIAAEAAAFALSLGLIQRTGVPVEAFMEVLRRSALYAATFDKKLPRLLERDYTNPNFSTRHLLKDVELCLTEAARHELDPSVLQGVQRVLTKTLDLGLAEADYSSLYNEVNPPT